MPYLARVAMGWDDGGGGARGRRVRGGSTAAGAGDGVAGGDAAVVGEGLPAGPPSRLLAGRSTEARAPGDRGEVGGGDRGGDRGGGGGDRGAASGVTVPGTVNGINETGCSVPCKK